MIVRAQCSLKFPCCTSVSNNSPPEAYSVIMTTSDSSSNTSYEDHRDDTPTATNARTLRQFGKPDSKQPAVRQNRHGEKKQRDHVAAPTTGYQRRLREVYLGYAK